MFSTNAVFSRDATGYVERVQHLIKLINKSTFLYLAVDKSQSNLAIVRAAVSRHAPELV